MTLSPVHDVRQSHTVNGQPSATPRLHADADEVFSLCVTIRSGHTRRFVLDLGHADLRRVRLARAVESEFRIEVDGPTLSSVRAGFTSGTAIVMSGQLDAVGEWSSVARFAAGTTAGSSFRAWCHAVSAAPPPDPVSPGSGPPVIAVLGSTNDDVGRLSPMAVSRLTAAANLARADRRARLVLTGGFGVRSNPAPLPHWQYAALFLERQGVLREQVLAVVNSRHTYEDILLLREVVRNCVPSSVTVVTSGFHAQRVRSVLDLVLPEGLVHPVPSHALPRTTQAALRRHDVEALGKTIVSALLFGPDRLRGEAARADLGWTTCWTVL